jgi:hypothetical protein
LIKAWNGYPPGPPAFEKFMPFMTTTCLAERRATIRFLCTLEPLCFPLQTAGAACCQARVQNISQTGIGLLLDQPLEPGTIVGLDMGSQSRRRARVLMARVIHVTAQGDGSWLVGCEFTFQLTDRDLKALLQSPS